MLESKYKPRPCAFHPKENIVNFCKNPECLLPLCPTCVRTHGEQHKFDSSYGCFQNIHKVTNEVEDYLLTCKAEARSLHETIQDDTAAKTQAQQQVSRKIHQAKSKMISAVERFFNDFQRDVVQAFRGYNDNMKENYSHITEEIKAFEKGLDEKLEHLGTQRVLKTVISFYTKQQEKLLDNRVQKTKQNLESLRAKDIVIRWDGQAVQKVVDQLKFLNYAPEIRYSNEFVKTARNFADTAESNYHAMRPFH